MIITNRPSFAAIADRRFTLVDGNSPSSSKPAARRRRGRAVETAA